MSDNELLIKINADAANAKKAFDDIKDKTDDLESALNKVALISGAVFAAFTAEIFLSVKAFEEARVQSVELSNALQNQGIFTEELKKKYEGYAAAVQASTGIDDNAIQKAQGIAQAHLGQTEVTLDLTKAIVDLSTTMGGDLNAAAEKIGITVGTSINAFRRQGLQIDATASSAEKMAKVLEFVTLKAGGQADAMNKADGYTKALASSFDHFQESIGQRFAPIIETARLGAIAFFNVFTEHPVFADLAASAIAAGVVVTGIIALVAAGVPLFLGLSAAVTALGVSMSLAFVGIPALVGLAVAAVTLLALNWNKSMATMKAAAAAAVTLISELFYGLGNVLAGAISLHPEYIVKGLEQIKDAFGKAKDVAIETYTEITKAQVVEGDKQNQQKKVLADQQAAIERQHQANLRAIRTAETQLLSLQNQHASDELIALKSKEIETLKALDAQHSKDQLKLYSERRDEIQKLEAQASKEEIERAQTLAQAEDDVKTEFELKGIQVSAKLRAQETAAIRATAKSEEDIDRQLQTELLQKKIAANNQQLLERKKYGAAAALINKAIYSDEAQGADQAAGELVQLEQSKNATLKEIGKAAAVADITIKTAQSAMNIFEGFSTIPIVGPILGVAGAAAAIIYGGERIAQVTGAAQGGLMTGGIPGVDSIPVLAQAGELIAPKQNFEEVVGAVRNQRQGGDNEEMLKTLQSIDGKISTPQTTVIQGDVHTDDSYVLALVQKISDAVQFRNAKIFGVNT